MLVYPRELQAVAQPWIQLGGDIDGEATGDYSSTSVSLSGDGTVLAVGANGNDGNGSDSGHVRVYNYLNNAWTQLGNDIDGEASDDYSGWSVSLSSDGSVLAVGAPYNGGNGYNSGHIWVYKYLNNEWTKLGNDIDGEAAGDYSGWSVSLSSDGTVLAVGAHQNDGNGNNSGHVRVYKYLNSAWTKLGPDIDGEVAFDKSGWSVSLSNDGTVIAVGAPYNRGNGSYSGHVWVFSHQVSGYEHLAHELHPHIHVCHSNLNGAPLSSHTTLCISHSPGTDFTQSRKSIYCPNH